MMDRAGAIEVDDVDDAVADDDVPSLQIGVQDPGVVHASYCFARSAQASVAFARVRPAILVQWRTIDFTRRDPTAERDAAPFPRHT